MRIITRSLGSNIFISAVGHSCPPRPAAGACAPEPCLSLAFLVEPPHLSTAGVCYLWVSVQILFLTSVLCQLAFTTLHPPPPSIQLKNLPIFFHDDLCPVKPITQVPLSFSRGRVS